MATPRRYVGEVFSQDGRWYQQGKLGPYRTLDRFDTTRRWLGKVDPSCRACANNAPHSYRFHHDAVLDGRRRAVCTPTRSSIIQCFYDDPPDALEQLDIGAA